jgi:DNA-binding MarR family transcriptional regulator
MLPLNFDPADAGRRHIERRWGGGSATAGSAAMSVMRVNEILMEELNETLAGFGLNATRYETLMLLIRSGGAVPMRRISEYLHVQAASVTNIVDRLERDTLASREALPQDRRVLLASITPRGRRVAARATTALEQRSLAINALDEEELAELIRLLRKARIRAGDFGNVHVVAP